MARFNPLCFGLEITRLFEQGQSYFAPAKVETWLRQHGQNPSDYEISFHQELPPAGSSAAMWIRIDLKRWDGQPVDPWLLKEINRVD